jgi:hypothetical protein
LFAVVVVVVVVDCECSSDIFTTNSKKEVSRKV